MLHHATVAARRRMSTAHSDVRIARGSPALRGSVVAAPTCCAAWLRGRGQPPGSRNRRSAARKPASSAQPSAAASSASSAPRRTLPYRWGTSPTLRCPVTAESGGPSARGLPHDLPHGPLRDLPHGPLRGVPHDLPRGHARTPGAAAPATAGRRPGRFLRVRRAPRQPAATPRWCAPTIPARSAPGESLPPASRETPGFRPQPGTGRAPAGESSAPGGAGAAGSATACPAPPPTLPGIPTIRTAPACRGGHRWCGPPPARCRGSHPRRPPWPRARARPAPDAGTPTRRPA